MAHFIENHGCPNNRKTQKLHLKYKERKKKEKEEL